MELNKLNISCNELNSAQDLFWGMLKEQEKGFPMMGKKKNT